MGRVTEQKSIGTQGIQEVLRAPSTLQLVDNSAMQRIELLGPFVNSFILVLALGTVTQLQQVIYLHEYCPAQLNA